MKYEPPQRSQRSFTHGTYFRPHSGLSMGKKPIDDGKHNDSQDIEKKDDAAWESLYIRIARLRLEEENRKRFLRSRPAKLPYQKCKEWVQSQNLWHSKEEWYAWVDQGENLSAYIPSDPEDYYTFSGTWVSWSDFLGN